ncbi:MAG: metallophosphoesterase [Proteobacteria bacterium]|nr:metallophosphoesterase [Pseudomonadota bacterium]
MILFMTIFLLLYGGVHYYIFLKARAAFAFGVWPGVSLALVMAIMISMPVLTRFAVRYGFESPARLLAFVGYLWMGFVLLFFTCSLLIDLYRLLVYAAGLILRRDFSQLIPSTRYLFFLPLLYSLFTATYGYLEAKSVRAERITIKTSKIPRETRKLTIAQISDLHLGLIIRESRLTRILEEVKKAKPDIVVSTGDLVDEQINHLAGCAELFREIRPRYGKFAVAGNHEFYAGLPHALQFIQDAGFSVLRGEGITIAGAINIAGVDDDQAGKRLGLMKEVSEPWLLSRLPREHFTILLKHQPRVEKGSTDLFDLQLSGHTHKGQFFPFNIFTHYIYPVDSGFVNLGNNAYLNVNRGAGTWGPPIRLLSPPEVTIIELIHEDKQE